MKKYSEAKQKKPVPYKLIGGHFLRARYRQQCEYNQSHTSDLATDIS